MDYSALRLTVERPPELIRGPGRYSALPDLGCKVFEGPARVESKTWVYVRMIEHGYLDEAEGRLFELRIAYGAIVKTTLVFYDECHQTLRYAHVVGYLSYLIEYKLFGERDADKGFENKI